MPEITIRLAAVDELIADLSRQTFYDTFALQNTQENMHKFMSEQFTRQKLIDEVKEPWLAFFLAFMNDQPVGYVKLRDSSVPLVLANQSCIEIARIYSVQQMIGTGVGKKLMQTCVDIANQKQKQVLWLAVWEKNQRAIDFYHKWGFERCGEQDFILGDDVQRDWLMKMVVR
jgi:ribosomal protein S18 acetylase RimI-like enzyme